jgi:hypothetical protein
VVHPLHLKFARSSAILDKKGGRGFEGSVEKVIRFESSIAKGDVTKTSNIPFSFIQAGLSVA